MEAQPKQTAASEPSIDIVIVNWNAGGLLQTCLAALAASSIVEQLNVIVVDNASTDSSARDLAVSGLRLEVIYNASNRGFAAACNQGAEAGRARYLLFLNPDARVERETLARALHYMNVPAQRRTGVLGVRLLDGSGCTARSCVRRPTAAALLQRTLFLDRIAPRLFPGHFLTEWDHLETRPVAQVMGAFLMIRRDLFVAAGGFDERFFVYYEDLDLCLRVADRGHAVVHFAEATAVHDGGGTSSAVKDRRLCYETTSRVHFMHKWHGLMPALLLIALITVIELPVRFIHATLTRSPREGWLVLRGAYLFECGLPRLLLSLNGKARAPIAAQPTSLG